MISPNDITQTIETTLPEIFGQGLDIVSGDVVPDQISGVTFDDARVIIRANGDIEVVEDVAKKNAMFFFVDPDWYTKYPGVF